MIKLQDILNEGVYDPGIFKAVFTAGGPGSGKSYTASSLFGMPETMPYVSAKGLKGVNSDSAFETFLDKANLSHDVKSLNPDDYEKAMDLRNQAKRVTAKRMHSYINSKLGMLIDGTGKNYDKISNMARQLRKQGYDCYMVFVNTSLEVALQRNQQRSRKVPDDVVKKGHAAVSNNMGRFQGLFGTGNAKPIQNKIAKKWIAKELELKRR